MIKDFFLTLEKKKEKKDDYVFEKEGLCF